GLASCDKPIIAAIMRQLALLGKLDLNASVFKVLNLKPAGKVIDKRVWDITVQHLMDHKAGWQGEPLARANQAYEASGGKAPPATAFPVWVQKQLEHVMCQQLKNKPGEVGEYDNFAFITMRLVIIKVAGKSFGEYLAHDLCRPFGV